MLKAGVLYPFSPSAFQALLRTSVLHARNGTTGAAMSLIDKTDVKNHLSARHRTQIHLAPSPNRPDTANPLLEEPAGAAAEDNSSVHTPLHAIAPVEHESATIDLSKTPQETSK